MALSERPGNLVFGRRRFMRSLAPADGTLGTPPALCLSTILPLEISVIIRTANLPIVKTIPNPAVVLTSS